MKRTLTAAAVALFAVSAHAYIDVQLDNPHQVANRPGSGNIEVSFTGTIDVEFGYDATNAVVEFPGLTAAGPFLVAGFDPGFLTYLGAASPDVDYTGPLFFVTVEATDALGFYSKNGVSPQAGSELFVFATNVDVFADNEFYSVNVVPEPASIAVLGIGAAALLRRRRR